MDVTKIMEWIQTAIDDSKTAILASVDEAGFPSTRWITPGCVNDRTGVVYIVSDYNSAKAKQLLKNPLASMMFQTKTLTIVVTARGRINVIKNPSVLAETLEGLGKNLHAFWKLENENRDLVVLEFVIEEAVYYQPLNGLKESVSFTTEE